MLIIMESDIPRLIFSLKLSALNASVMPESIVRKSKFGEQNKRTKNGLWTRIASAVESADGIERINLHPNDLLALWSANWIMGHFVTYRRTLGNISPCGSLTSNEGASCKCAAGGSLPGGETD